MLILATLIAFYGLVWGLTIFCREKAFDAGYVKRGYASSDGHVYLGAIWPLYLPTLLSYMLAKKISETEIKLPKRKPKVAKNEIAPGVPCPIDAVIQMAKASLVKDFEVAYSHIKNDKVDLYAIRGTFAHTCTLEIGSIKLESEDFTDAHRDDLTAFYEDMIKLDKARKEAARLAEIRGRAIDGIESLLEPIPNSGDD